LKKSKSTKNAPYDDSSWVALLKKYERSEYIKVNEKKAPRFLSGLITMEIVILS